MKWAFTDQSLSESLLTVHASGRIRVGRLSFCNGPLAGLSEDESP